MPLRAYTRSYAGRITSRMSLRMKYREDVDLAREQDLHSDFWRAIITLGSTTHRFEDITKFVWGIIHSFSIPPASNLMGNGR